MINNLQIYISETFNPYTNLATEKYLVDTVPEKSYILYLWQNENTVVIGRNQNAWNECRCALLESEGGFLARRLSGGGAVFHDKGNLNFTFICSCEDYNLEKHLQVIKAACSRAGICAEISGRNDILVDGRKFSGNAFYNSKGKSYHHGTILISSDTEKLQRYLTPPKAKLQSKGIKSVKSRVINLSEIAPTLSCEVMKEYMCAAFESVFKIKAEKHQIPKTEEIAALAKLYGSREYLYGNPIPFTVSMEDRFDWGNISLCLDVQSGTIKTVKLYTDSMDWQLSEKAETALTGCKFNIEAMINAIESSTPDSFHKDFKQLIKKNLV